MGAFAVALMVLAAAGPPPAEPFRKTLVSAEQGVRLESWQVSRGELGMAGPDWSVRKAVLHGGRQEGVDVVVVDNGRLRLTVVPTRGMGLLRVDRGDLRLGWDSPIREVVHPQFVELGRRGGLGWLEGFNELLVRCGLESAGHPGRDRFVNNLGEEAEMELTLHGRIGNIPASEVEVVVDAEPPHRIRVRGRVEETVFHGPKLQLFAEVSTEPGSDAFRIDDRVTNRGAGEQEFQVIYHANYGAPLLEEGARVVAAARRVVPFNDHAAKGVSGWDRYAGPTPGFVEQVYCLHPWADADGRTALLLKDRAGERAVSMTFPLEQLPYATVWKYSAAREDGYVTGLEPGTGFPYNRRIERAAGRVPRLGPGKTRRFTIDFAVHVGAGEVARAAERVVGIQAGRPTRVETSPEPGPRP